MFILRFCTVIFGVWASKYSSIRGLFLFKKQRSIWIHNILVKSNGSVVLTFCKTCLMVDWTVVHIVMLNGPSFYSANDEDFNISYECSICKDPDNEEGGSLIRACNCKGDIGVRHHECLKRWLIEVSFGIILSWVFFTCTCDVLG